MYVIKSTTYGGPDRLRLQETEKPALEADRVLVRIRAASVNPYDWHLMRGQPYLVRLSEGFRRPKRGVPGVDLAGVVEAVGSTVTELRAGDEVFGTGAGSFAEYAATCEKNLVPKPAGLTFEQAAAVPIAGCTALQGLRDHGRLQPGQRVLINGAAGGVGTFAVQIAKALGGIVTAVCSTRNVELVRSLGADEVIDYTGADFTRPRERYDLVFDLVGNRPLRALRRTAIPTGSVILCGAGPHRRLGPLVPMLGAVVVSRFADQRLGSFMAKNSRDDLLVLTELIEAGKVTPVVDRTYPLSEAPEAIRYLETGHARAKVVITM